MQHSPRFLNYTTDRVRRHQRLKVAEESIIPTRSDQTDAVAATFLNIDSDFAARVHSQHRKGKGYSTNPWAPAGRYNTASLPKVQSTGLQRFRARMQTMSA
jgi:hypothetical protein